mgnify:CR=1 FL=1
MKKRLVLVLVVCLCVGILAAGCAPKEPEASASAEPEASAPSEETAAPAAEVSEITLWNYWETPKHQETLGRVVDEFNASQDSVVLTTEYIPFADFKKQLSIGVVSDQLPDIVIIDNPDHAAYASMGIFADLTDKLADWPDLDQYYQGPVNSATLDGRLYGLPFGSNCLLLFYNEDMLAEADCEVPATWDDLISVGKATTKDGVTGLGVSALQNEEGTFQFLPWLWSTGATSYEMNSEGGIRALTLYQDLIAEGAMSKEVINWTQGDAMNQFISGNLAMMINGPWQVPTMRAEAPDLNWNVAPIPEDAMQASDLGGENFAIINNDNVDASVSFLKFVASPDMMTTYINDFGYIASRQDVSETQFTDDPIMQAFADEMQYAYPRGPHPRWPEISNAISLAFNEVITETSDPATAAQKAQDTIDGIIQ